MAIIFAFFVFVGAMHCLGACRVSGLEELASFVSLVMMFSFVISRGQLSPGTDKSPERRAENMKHR
jgi:hypothetical protein